MANAAEIKAGRAYLFEGTPPKNTKKMLCPNCKDEDGCKKSDWNKNFYVTAPMVDPVLVMNCLDAGEARMVYSQTFQLDPNLVRMNSAEVKDLTPFANCEYIGEEPKKEEEEKVENKTTNKRGKK